MWLILALGYWLLAVVIHSIFCRLPISINIVVKFVVGGFLVGLMLIYHTVLFYGLELESLSTILLYGFICELYIFCFTLVGSSVSAALLLKLRSNGLTYDEINQLYSATNMVDSRFKNLLSTGLIESTQWGYQVTSKGQKLLMIFNRLKGIFRL